MFSYFMGNFFHNLKHILESQLYLGTGMDWLPNFSFYCWLKKMTSHFTWNSFFWGNWRMSRNKKCFNSNDFDLLFTYWLAGLFFFACTTMYTTNKWWVSISSQKQSSSSLIQQCSMLLSLQTCNIQVIFYPKKGRKWKSI